MKLPRRKFLHLASGFAALPVVLHIAWAQTYPSRPVRIIVGYPPGGSADVVARLVNPAVPAKTVPGFIAYAKANPHKVNMASNGNGGLLHLAGELFKMMTGVDLVHVPYRGAQPALTDLISGQVQVMFAASTVEYIKTGKVRALAVTTPTRPEVLPDVPPLSEFVPGYDAAAWIGVGAPKNTLPEIIDKLNNKVNARWRTPN